MAVSAQLTDFGVHPDGEIDEPPRTGNDFVHEGIRVDRSVGFLMSLEQAVDIAHRRTGALTIEVPRLVLASVDGRTSSSGELRSIAR